MVPSLVWLRWWGSCWASALNYLAPAGTDLAKHFLKINVPIGVLALAGAARFLPEIPPSRRVRIDLLGVALLSLFFRVHHLPAHLWPGGGLAAVDFSFPSPRASQF